MFNDETNIQFIDTIKLEFEGSGIFYMRNDGAVFDNYQEYNTAFGTSYRIDDKKISRIMELVCISMFDYNRNYALDNDNIKVILKNIIPCDRFGKVLYEIPNSYINQANMIYNNICEIKEKILHDHRDLIINHNLYNHIDSILMNSCIMEKMDIETIIIGNHPNYTIKTDCDNILKEIISANESAYIDSEIKVNILRGSLFGDIIIVGDKEIDMFNLRLLLGKFDILYNKS